MNILHTADWHLGKRLDEYQRHDEQVLVLQEIANIADEINADVVIIAGDLYDSINPPLESQALFYRILKNIAKDGARPVIAIAGNHDSPDRIDSPDPLAKECGILFIGKPMATIEPFSIPDKFEITKSAPGFFELQLPHQPPLRIIHTAYANELRLKTYLGEDKTKGLNEALAKHWDQLANTYCDEKGINILVTHLYMQPLGNPLEEPEGEKPLNIGNADVVYTNAIPKQIQYTALGHLHRHQNIGTAEQPIIYSSAPLAYSFAEAGQQKYVVHINANINEQLSYTKLPLQNGRMLYRKTFDNIDDAVIWLQENQNTLVELTIISETFLTPSELKQLHAVHDGIIFIIPIVNNKNQKLGDTKTELDLTQNVQTIFEEFYKVKKKGLNPSEELLNIFKEIIA